MLDGWLTGADSGGVPATVRAGGSSGGIMARKTMADLDLACKALGGTMRARGLMADGAVFLASRRNGYVCVDCYTNDGRMVESLLVGHTVGSAVEAVWAVSRALELGRRTVSGRV